ncbi:MAG: ferric reductase-like transmembrane domain-containing protein [Candidatus Saccharibacteria bacterium]
MSSLTLFATEPHVRLFTTWTWYLTRAAGLMASILLVILMITGISMFTGYQYKFMQPLKAWANHRTLGILFTVAILLHVIPLLFDKFIPFNVYQILLPFASGYKHTHLLGVAVGSLGVALGVISLYMIVAIVFTSLNKIMTKYFRAWKLTHFLSYAVIVFVFFHSIMIGTDLKNGLWRALWVIANLVVLGFIGLRWRRKGSLKD